ncbi:uncharacterized protein G2W53_020187 [Senna tora]|uniref:Uncharacterized protein n=1 Tax=Senna tora TaxID=362788 RepID=A0A834WPW4_9FABA|nr:uncharacterized protein G2W53_020187 [Senna tora]
MVILAQNWGDTERSFHLLQSQNQFLGILLGGLEEMVVTRDACLGGEGISPSPPESREILQCFVVVIARDELVGGWHEEKMVQADSGGVGSRRQTDRAKTVFGGGSHEIENQSSSVLSQEGDGIIDFIGGIRNRRALSLLPNCVQFQLQDSSHFLEKILSYVNRDAYLALAGRNDACACAKTIGSFMLKNLPIRSCHVALSNTGAD